MLRDFEKIISFLEPNRRKKLEEGNFSLKDDMGNIIEEHTLKDILREKKFDHKNLFIWLGMRDELLEEIACDAYKKMVKIVNAFSVKSGISSSSDYNL